MNPSTPTRFRRVIRQVHLWSGLVLGLYLAMLSLTGSALVYRLELIRHFQVPAPEFDPERTPLSPEALADAARRAHPGYEVTSAGTRISRYRPVIEVRLAKGDEEIDRLFDPYTGKDLGEAASPAMRTLTWLAQLHDELLLGETGRLLNGIGSALVGLLVVTGLVTWWPSLANRQVAGTGFRPARPLQSRVHRQLGIWGAAVLLIWVVSGIYFAFPEPFNAAATFVSGDDLAGLGYDVLTWLTYLHFGRFSAAVQVVWLVVGLLPTVLVITGISMWWTRRARRRAEHWPAPAPSRASHPLPRLVTTPLALVIAACCAWALYSWANYREEHHVERFLAAVAAGQYRQAHAMWDGRDYTFERFLSDWGNGGQHAASPAGMEVVDSTTYGATVTVYVRTAASTPLALEVDKETLALAYASFNEYSPDAAAE